MRSRGASHRGGSFVAQDNRLWVISSYFNSQNYDSHYKNFLAFRRNLRAPLLVVELSKSGAFQLTPNDADILIQLRGEDTIWQKERLLNLAMEALPGEADYVAWVDCDVIFEDDAWARRAQEKLSKHSLLLQPFSTATHLTRDAQPETLIATQCKNLPRDIVETSISKAFIEGEHEASRLWADRRNAAPRELGPFVAYGIAWSARREDIQAIALYDRNAIGGGDLVMIGAAVGIETLISLRPFTPAHAADIRLWAEGFRQRFPRDPLGYMPGNLFHLWHGAFEHRYYRARNRVLIEHGYDPARDLALAENGAWRWRDPHGALAGALSGYFASRREDG